MFSSEGVLIRVYLKDRIYCSTYSIPQDDVHSHLYTLIVRSDNTYEVKIDNKKVEGGELEADWDFLPPKKIKVCFLSSYSRGE